MAKITGVPSLLKKLGNLAKKAKDDSGSVSVGYTQRYAIYVHEIAAKHKEGKTWKYLEIPARKMSRELPRVIREAYNRGATLKQALFMAGLRLQRESQLIVPIDTGALRASAFTAFTEDEEKAAAAAFNRGEKKRSASNEKSAKRSAKRKWGKTMKRAAKIKRAKIKRNKALNKAWRRKQGGK